MKILIILLLAFNIDFITSNIQCSSSINSKVINKNRAEDLIDIQFSSLSSVNGITFNAILLINVSDSYLQQNVKQLDFQLTYSDNGNEIVQNCHYDIPSDGSVLRILPFEYLKFFTKYAITVGYTLKSGESFTNKANTTFETCFGTPETPTNLMISSQSLCAVEIQWKAPTVINAPKVCYYAISMRLNGSQVNFNVEQTSYIQILQPNINYTFFIQAVNNRSCYSNESSNCSTSSSGSQSAFISYTLPSGTSCSGTTQPPPSTTSAAFTFNLNLILLIVLFLLYIINQF
jgi:hypothetical protein